MCRFDASFPRFLLLFRGKWTNNYVHWLIAVQILGCIRGKPRNSETTVCYRHTTLITIITTTTTHAHTCCLLTAEIEGNAMPVYGILHWGKVTLSTKKPKTFMWPIQPMTSIKSSHVTILMSVVSCAVLMPLAMLCFRSKGIIECYSRGNKFLYNEFYIEVSLSIIINSLRRKNLFVVIYGIIVVFCGLSCRTLKLRICMGFSVLKDLCTCILLSILLQ